MLGKLLFFWVLVPFQGGKLWCFQGEKPYEEGRKSFPISSWDHQIQRIAPGFWMDLCLGGYPETYGGFLKCWYPQIIYFNMVFHYKPSILGYHYFRKHPYGIRSCFEKKQWHACRNMFPRRSFDMGWWKPSHGKGADDFRCWLSHRYGTGSIVGFGTGLPKSLDTQTFQIGPSPEYTVKPNLPAFLFEINTGKNWNPDFNHSRTTRPASSTVSEVLEILGIRWNKKNTKNPLWE